MPAPAGHNVGCNQADRHFSPSGAKCHASLGLKLWGKRKSYQHFALMGQGNYLGLLRIPQIFPQLSQTILNKLR
jgi:hypothetical protein